MCRLFRVIFILLTCICLTGFAFSDTFAEKYSHNDFSLEIPERWYETKTFYAEAIEALFTKEIDAEINPIMMIAIGDRVRGSTIKDVVEQAVNMVTSTIPDAKFLFERDVYTGNVKWRELIYQYSDAGYLFQTVQYHTINNKKHYAFTGQSLQSDFREHLAEFRKTFNTWQFKAD